MLGSDPDERSLINASVFVYIFKGYNVRFDVMASSNEEYIYI